MKYIFILLTAILLLTPNNAQSQTSEEIQSHLLQYFESISNKDYDTFYNLLSPSYRKHLTKEFAINLIGSVDNDERFINQLVDFDLGEVSEPVIHGDTIYIKLDYLAERHLVYTDAASDEFIDRLNTTFSKSHSDNFKYIPSEKKVITSNPASVILCINIADDEWYFIPYRPKLYPYMHLLMPKEAAEELLKEE
ncbi:hypothetical protein LJC28_02095 [Dysgonomonas sp. OttesenSCG-928-D17]|nr:hypothetical protein [Dysgonomonas sp. OttesenSCG-928-D17]